MEFKVGDVVELKSGSPKLIVISLPDGKGKDEDLLQVNSADSDMDKKTIYIHPELLKLAQDDVR